MTTIDSGSSGIPLAARKARMRLTWSVLGQVVVGVGIVLMMSGLFYGPGPSLAYLVSSCMPYAFLVLLLLLFVPRLRRRARHVALVAAFVVIGSEVVVHRYYREVADAQSYCDSKLDDLRSLESTLSERQLAEAILVNAPEILRFMNYLHCVVSDCNPRDQRTFYLSDYMRAGGVKRRGWQLENGIWHQVLVPWRTGAPRGG